MYNYNNYEQTVTVDGLYSSSNPFVPKDPPSYKFATNQNVGNPPPYGAATNSQNVSSTNFTDSPPTYNEHMTLRELNAGIPFNPLETIWPPNFQNPSNGGPSFSATDMNKEVSSHNEEQVLAEIQEEGNSGYALFCTLATIAALVAVVGIALLITGIALEFTIPALLIAGGLLTVIGSAGAIMFGAGAANSSDDDYDNGPSNNQDMRGPYNYYSNFNNQYDKQNQYDNQDFSGPYNYYPNFNYQYDLI